MKIITLLLAAILFSVELQAQSVIKLVVVDSATKNIIPAATIQMDGTAAISDSSGFTSFSLPNGLHRISITAVGYKSRQAN